MSIYYSQSGADTFKDAVEKLKLSLPKDNYLLSVRFLSNDEIDKTYRVGIKAAVASDIETLFGQMEYIIDSKNGLADDKYGNSSSGYFIINALESVNDKKAPGLLVEYIKKHKSDPAKNNDEIVNRLLHGIEKIGNPSLRGDLIELIFDNVLLFVNWDVPDVFGRFTELLRSFVKAYKGKCIKSRHGPTDNDGYEEIYEYDAAPLESEFDKLCGMDNPVVSNFLCRFSSLPVIKVREVYTDLSSNLEIDPIEKIKIREKSRKEISQRGISSKNSYKVEEYENDEYFFD